LIIGILAAIALPTFLGQREKAQDSSAKSDARNMVSHMESCFTDAEDYTGCNAKLVTAANTGLNIVASTATPGKGEVSASGESTTGYTVVARSKSNRLFTIAHTGSGNARSCAPNGGGCNAATW
jgi:type IV pilus assembly protein PilA